MVKKEKDEMMQKRLIILRIGKVEIRLGKPNGTDDESLYTDGYNWWLLSKWSRAYPGLQGISINNAIAICKAANVEMPSKIDIATVLMSLGR